MYAKKIEVKRQSRYNNRTMDPGFIDAGFNGDSYDKKIKGIRERHTGKLDKFQIFRQIDEKEEDIL